MRKKRICSRFDMTDQQARDQVNLSEYAADIIKQTETDYGKKLSTTGWGKIMDYLENMIYDTKKFLSDSERKIKIEDYIYQIYESDTGIDDIYTARKVTCSVNKGGMRYALIRKDPVKVSIGGNDDEIVNAIMEMSKDDLEKLYNSVIRKYFKMTQGRAYDVGRKSRMSEKYTPRMSERDLIDTLVYLVQEGAIVPTKKASNVKGGTSIMRKKNFSVKASMSAKRRNNVMSTRRGTMRKRVCAAQRPVRASESDRERYNIVLSRDEANELKDFLRKNRIKFDSSGYGADTYIQFDLTKRESDMINDFLDAVADHATIDVEEYFERLPEVNSAKSVRCARTMRKRPVKASTKRRFAIKSSVGDSVDVDEIKQILRDAGVKTWGVKKSSYHGGDLIEIVFDDTNDYSKATSALEDAGFNVKFDSSNGANVYYFTIDDNREAEAYLYRVVFEYNNEVVPMDDKTNDYQAVLDACIDEMESDGKTGYLYTYDEAMDYARELADDEADVERIMEEEFVEGGNHGLYLFTAGNFNIIPIGFGKASEYVGSAVRCSRSMRRRSTRAIKASADYGSQSYKVLRVLRDYINMEFNKTMIDDVEVYVGDIYETANDSFAFDVSLDPKNDYERETKIKVVSSDELYAKDVFYCKVGLDTRDGGYFEISRFGAKDTLADKIDEVAESISSGDSVNSAKSIRCEDEDAEIVEDDFSDDEDYEDDNAELTVDISNLELGEPFYEMREDDPENPDKWVLVIGKDAEKQMNFKLWYYVDSTDADLTALDLSNPDHIDLDEESMIEDYDEIQLATNVSCKDGCVDQRYDAGLVTM